MIPDFENLLTSFTSSISDKLDLTSNTPLSIIDFIEHELNLGISLTKEQILILKLMYGLELTEVETSILEYWQLLQKTTCTDPSINPSIFVFEAGRRCITPDSLIHTTKGILSLSELVEEASEGWHATDFTVLQPAECRYTNLPVKNYYATDTLETVKLTTSYGFQIEGSKEHRIKVVSPKGSIVWKPLGSITKLDKICINKTIPEYSVIQQELPSNPYTDTITTDWAYFFGVISIAGVIKNNVLSIEISYLDTDLIAFLDGFIPYSSKCHNRNKYFLYVYRNETLCSFLTDLGFIYDFQDELVSIPRCIRSADLTTQASYIQGTFDPRCACGLTPPVNVKLYMPVTIFSRQFHLLLLNFGIVAKLEPLIWQRKLTNLLTIQGRFSLLRFVESNIKGLRFSHARRNITKAKVCNTFDNWLIPNQSFLKSKINNILKQLPIQLLSDSIPGFTYKHHILSNFLWLDRHDSFINVKGTHITHKSLVKLGTVLDYIPHSSLDSCRSHIRSLLATDYFFDPVLKIESGSSKCYDLEVKPSEHYISGGITSHNSGKSTISAIAGAFEFYNLCKMDSPQQFYNISSSTNIGILVLATTSSQTKKTIFGEIVGVLRNSPYFKRLEALGKLFIGKQEISHDEKRVYISAGNSKSASQVGGTLKCIIMDEVARFQDSDGDSNALLLWSNLGISCAPFGAAAKRIAISSAWYEGDAIQKLYEATANDANAVGLKAKSWEINPIHAARDSPIVNSEYLLDPVKAALEFEGIRPAVTDAFLSPADIPKAFSHTSVLHASRYVTNDLVHLHLDSLIKTNDYQSVLHIDPSVSSDSFALAFGHTELCHDGVRPFTKYFIDGLLAWEPDHYTNVSFRDVFNAILTIHNARPLIKVTADHFNSVETIQNLKSHGIPSEVVYFSNKQQLIMYDHLRQLLHSGHVVFPADSTWSSKLRQELLQLMLIKNNKIDHPTGGSKDLADSVASVCYALSRLSSISSSFSSSVVQPLTQKNPVIQEVTPRQIARQFANSRRNWLKSIR